MGRGLNPCLILNTKGNMLLSSQIGNSYLFTNNNVAFQPYKFNAFYLSHKHQLLQHVIVSLLYELLRDIA